MNFSFVNDGVLEDSFYGSSNINRIKNQELKNIL